MVIDIKILNVNNYLFVKVLFYKEDFLKNLKHFIKKIFF